MNNALLDRFMIITNNNKTGLKNTILCFLFLILFTAFNFRDIPTGSWNPQYIYNTNGQSIKDIAFADSLNGYITLRSNVTGGKILKTANGGDTWYISYPSSDSGLFSNIKLFNKDSCLICNAYRLYKTTDGGQNWLFISPPYILGTYFIEAINFDTIWAGVGTGFNQPQLYLTTNGGLNWIKKFELSSGSQFDYVYFYNKRIGFCSFQNGIYKTTNGGNNWFWISGEPYTKKIQFVDSLTGWKCDTYQPTMKKTTDGGYNWTTQSLPSGGLISESYMYDFQALNKDTIWGCGGQMYISPIFIRKGLIYKTINGGVNWGYQLPDTNLVNKFDRYFHIYFINNKIGWVYDSDSNSFNKLGGIHTITGGLDSTIYVGIKGQNQFVTSEYVLYQNYPNPFNSISKIKYKIEKATNIKIIVFDIIGKEIKALLNKRQTQGEYEVKFDGSNLSSGIYFYSLFADGVRIDTKKLILIK